MKGIAAPSTMFPLSIWFLCCKVEILFFPRTLFGCMFCPIFFLEATRQSVLQHPDPGPLHMFSEFEYMNLSFVLQYHCLGSFSHFFGFHHSLQCPADARSTSHWELEWKRKCLSRPVNSNTAHHSDFWLPKLERSVKLFNLIICSKSYTCRTPSHGPSAYLPAPPCHMTPPPHN